MLENSIMMDASLIHPMIMFWLALVMLLLFIFSIVFFVVYLKGKKKKFLWAFIVISLIFLGALGLQFLLNYHYNYSLNNEELEYEVLLISNSQGYDLVYMPISENIDLQDDIHVDEGIGTVDIIDTEYGQALSLNFTGIVRVHGRIETTSGLGSHDLTMVNDTAQSLRREFWIFYQPYDEKDYSCTFELELYHEAFDWWEWQTCEGSLRSGWNTYPFEGEVLS